MASLFVLVATIFTVGNCSPTIIIGTFRDGRGFATGKAYSNNYEGKSSILAEAQSSQGQFPAFTVYDAPTEYEVPLQNAVSTAVSNGLYKSASSSAISKGKGTAVSNANINSGSTLSQVKTKAAGYGSQSSSGIHKGASWHFGTLYDTAINKGNIHSGVDFAKSYLNSNDVPLAETNANVYDSNTNFAESTAMAQDSGLYIPSTFEEKNLASANSGAISYEDSSISNTLPVSLSANADVKGHGSAVSNANNNHGFLNTQSEVKGFGSAKASATRETTNQFLEQNQPEHRFVNTQTDITNARGSASSTAITQSGSVMSSSNVDDQGEAHAKADIHEINQEPHGQSYNHQPAANEIYFPNDYKKNKHVSAHSLASSGAGYLNSNANIDGAYGFSNSAANIHGGFIQSSAKVSSQGYADALASVNDHDRSSISHLNLAAKRDPHSSVNADVNVNGGHGTAKSEANSLTGIAKTSVNSAGLGFAKANANLLENTYGIYNYKNNLGMTNANSNVNGGHGVASSIVNTQTGSAKSSAKSSGFGSVSANANVHDIKYFPNFQRFSNDYVSSRVHDNQFSSTVSSTANTQGGIAKSSANTNSHGSASASSDVTGYGSAKSTANINDLGNYRLPFNDWSLQGERVQSEASTSGIGSASAYANTHGLRNKFLSSAAKITGFGSAHANVYSG